jgi:hypothetical protein
MRRRFLASTLDALGAILALALAFGGSYAVVSALGRERELARAFPRAVAGSRVKLALRLWSSALAVWLTWRQSPGFRFLGIRRVDVRTGSPASMRQAIVHVAARSAWRVLANRLTARLAPRTLPRPADLHSRIEALEREHAGDQAAFQRAVTELYRDHRVRPYAYLLPVLAQLPLAALAKAPILWSRANRDLPEMLAGTAVIVER